MISKVKELFYLIFRRHLTDILNFWLRTMKLLCVFFSKSDKGLICCAETDTGAGMATVIFFLFSITDWCNLVKKLEKNIHASHDLLI